MCIFVMHVLCELLYLVCYNKKLNDKKELIENKHTILNEYTNMKQVLRKAG